MSSTLIRILENRTLRFRFSRIKLGASWEGFALEEVLRITGDRDAYFWATHAGAELDLLVNWRGMRCGFESKYSDAPVMTKSMHIALEDLKLERIFTLYPGKHAYPIHEKVEALPLMQLHDRLTEFGGRLATKSRRIASAKTARKK